MIVIKYLHVFYMGTGEKACRIPRNLSWRNWDSSMNIKAVPFTKTVNKSKSCFRIRMNNQFLTWYVRTSTGHVILKSIQEHSIFSFHQLQLNWCKHWMQKEVHMLL